MKKVQDPDQAHIDLAQQTAAMVNEHAEMLRASVHGDTCEDYCFDLVGGSHGHASDAGYMEAMAVRHFINTMATKPALAAMLQHELGEYDYKRLFEAINSLLLIYKDCAEEHTQLIFKAQHIEGWYTDYTENELRALQVRTKCRMDAIIAEKKALSQASGGIRKAA